MLPSSLLVIATVSLTVRPEAKVRVPLIVVTLPLRVAVVAKVPLPHLPLEIVPVTARAPPLFCAADMFMAMFPCDAAKSTCARDVPDLPLILPHGRASLSKAKEGLLF